ncbi:MAG: hypothetical protein ACREQI_05870 [Candidatus Binataceae bacterium]
MKSSAGIAALAFTAAAAGCFYPPTTQPPPDARQQAIIPLPYDLAWDAVHRVITDRRLRVEAQDPNIGLIEASGGTFTLSDADCGKISSLGGSYFAAPEPDSTSVYNFLVRPRGREASLVEVRATFNSAVQVPLHPAHDVDCVSHGIVESNILREVLAAARITHRPIPAEPLAAKTNPKPGATAALVAARTSIEKTEPQAQASATPAVNPLIRHKPELLRLHLPPPPKF